MKIFKKIGFVLLGSAVVFGVAASINLSHALETKAAETAVISHSVSTTTNMTGGDDADLYGLADKPFSLVSDKNGGNNHVGVNKDGTFRLYYRAGGEGVILSVSLTDNSYHITGFTINYGGTVAKAKIVVDGIEKINETPTANGFHSLSNLSATAFSIQNVNPSNTQLYINTISIDYDLKSSPTVDVTDVTLAPKSVSVKATKSTTLTATITPSDATNKGLSWSSNNESVATVSGGVVTGVSAGTAIITVTTDDGGYTDTAQVTVLPEPVIEHDGTLADPYSVSDAILVAEDTGETATTASYYIRGFISLVKSVDTGTFGNAEFEIKDSLLDGEKFLVYRAFANSAGTAFTVESAKDIKVGFLATVYGKIVNYKSNTPETTAGSKNDSMTTHVHSIDKTQATTDASSFAVSFNTAISGVCDANGNTNVGNLTTAWDLQKTAYSAMTEGARYVAQISLADASGSDLEKAIAKYVYVANKYSLEDFMVRDDVAGAHIVSEIPNNSTNILLIIIVGLIGTSVLVGYRLVNKKKEN